MLLLVSRTLLRVPPKPSRRRKAAPPQTASRCIVVKVRPSLCEKIEDFAFVDNDYVRRAATQAAALGKRITRRRSRGDAGDAARFQQ
jgi:hypothetical protein